jgi:hypothetical protein
MNTVDNTEPTGNLRDVQDGSSFRLHEKELELEAEKEAPYHILERFQW